MKEIDQKRLLERLLYNYITNRNVLYWYPKHMFTVGVQLHLFSTWCNQAPAAVKKQCKQKTQRCLANFNVGYYINIKLNTKCLTTTTSKRHHHHRRRHHLTA